MRRKKRIEKVEDDEEGGRSVSDAEDMTGCAFELYAFDSGYPIKYEDVVCGAAVLTEYDPVVENDLVLEENQAFVDEEASILKYGKPIGWKLFAVLLAVMIGPVETAYPFDRDDQCLKADEPEEVPDMTDFIWFGVAILASWIALSWFFWWLGFRQGRQHVLQFRHVRSDRLGRLNAEARHQLLLVEKENERLQERLQSTDVWNAELVSLKELGRDVVRTSSYLPSQSPDLCGSSGWKSLACTPEVQPFVLRSSS